jgi:hypothetical protein
MVIIVQRAAEGLIHFGNFLLECSTGCLRAEFSLYRPGPYNLYSVSRLF